MKGYITVREYLAAGGKLENQMVYGKDSAEKDLYWVDGYYESGTFINMVGTDKVLLDVRFSVTQLSIDEAYVEVNCVPIMKNIDRPGLSYTDVLNSARQIHAGELQHITIMDTLRQLIVELKDRELYWDVKYHQLENAIDLECDAFELQAIYERINEPYERRVKESAFIMAKNSRNWNKQHRVGLENALMRLVNDYDNFNQPDFKVAKEQLAKHSLKYCQRNGLNWPEQADPFKNEP